MGEERAMSGLQHFFWMGGYWPYVWSSYSIVILGFSIYAINACKQHKKILNNLRQAEEPTSE